MTDVTRRQQLASIVGGRTKIIELQMTEFTHEF
jgi:hypothetical protein